MIVPEAVIRGNLTPILLPSKSSDTTKLGACESPFGEILEKYFAPHIYSQQELPPLNHQNAYTSDFLFVEPNTKLHIDIEIDEPFSFATNTPIHYVGKDDYRNKCFVEANWIVLRFAEEQVSSQPLRCLRVLSNVISKYTFNDSWLPIFKDVEKLTPVWQWTEGKSKKLSKNKYRNSYLR